jgi:agmatine deiminase
MIITINYHYPLTMNHELTPKQLGYYFPPEFAAHEATWLSWPHKEASWPGKIETIYQPYAQFVKALAESELVRINVNDEKMKSFAQHVLAKENVNMQQVEFFLHPTNDAWCRDHGPAFITNPDKKVKAIVDWNYNAWGNKYPPYDLDDIIPTLIGEHFNLPVFYPNIVMEGGSVEFNGKGTLLTSKSCLLNPNRNPQLNQQQIEFYLCEYYGVDQILWIDEGIDGDDTDGHIDDTVRFINEDTVIAVVEQNKEDENYRPLQKNLKALKKMRLLNGKQLNIIELPMPDEVFYEGQRLPASYVNFYVANNAVIVPSYDCDNDTKALEFIQQCFPSRKVIGINSIDIIWGLGSFHCLSQQEPKV